MAVTAAADPRNEKTCINRVRQGRSELVDGNPQVCIELLCVALKHLFRQPPKDEKRCRGYQNGTQEQDAAVYFFWLIHVFGFGKIRNLTIPSRLLDRNWIPASMRFSECSTLLKQTTRQLPRFLCSVYVFIAFPLGKYWAIDRSADSKGKLQLTVF
jgi:hypothetical protein